MDIDELISNAQKTAGDSIWGVEGDILRHNVLYISLLLINIALAFVRVHFTIKKRYNSPINIV